MDALPVGLYERLLDEELDHLLRAHPYLKPILRKIDDEESPAAYAQFVGQIVFQALRDSRPEHRLSLVNRLVNLLATTDGHDYLKRKQLLAADSDLLTSVTTHGPTPSRPQTSLAISTLLTGQGSDPPLEHELRSEMASADRVDILVSFIKWSGLRLLMPAIEHLGKTDVPVRVLSTSYMGASDPAALEWLARQANVTVRVSYDTGGTRLHAKAYYFYRKSGFSTAYIGSANMSHSAMTQGLEWTLKVTAQDQPFILQRFTAEFEGYWTSREFEPYTEKDFQRLRQAIGDIRSHGNRAIHFFAEITPRPFQLRILEELDAHRKRGQRRNLVVAATGTGKTVVAALDYSRTARLKGGRPRLLFVAHRKEILEQALGCFRTVLRDQNFGELFVDGMEVSNWDHVFASVQSLNNERPWEDLGTSYFEFVVVDEVHHGAAASYRPLFENLQPDILLGLTATPERMDGSSILPDFGGAFAFEIRLAEALEEKLLCPFHYFGVSDSVNLDEDRFWRNGQYIDNEIEAVLTGDDLRARARLHCILTALDRYQPELQTTRGIGFCAGVRHAYYMAERFREAKIAADVLLGDTPTEQRAERLRDFRSGEIKFLFTVDVLSEGVDIPDVNLVLFLRPTKSLTVFLQQLGRGLRHSPGKDCLTVLDFIGLTHRNYRIDTKYSALLSRKRQRIDREVEEDFPSLPPGCSIQLERVARERILSKIQHFLKNLQNLILETLKAWKDASKVPLNFENFISETKLSPLEILSRKTWSEWKALGRGQQDPCDPDLESGRAALMRVATRNDPLHLEALSDLPSSLEIIPEARRLALHYLLWGPRAHTRGFTDTKSSLRTWLRNRSLAEDCSEIAIWRARNFAVPNYAPELPFSCDIRLHACYSSAEINAIFGLSSVDRSGQTGTGVLHSKAARCYLHLVTFNKTERDFSPTTRYQDYPISQNLLQWESQSSASQESETGKNYLHFNDRGYTVLFFARLNKKEFGETMPYQFLGPAVHLVSYESERPIRIVWELKYSMPAALFEAARAV